MFSTAPPAVTPMDKRASRKGKPTKVGASFHLAFSTEIINSAAPPSHTATASGSAWEGA